MKLLTVVLFSGATALLSSTSSSAEPPSSVEIREREALAACDSGQIDKGIEILARLWAETLEPAYLYNQGRCYQKNGLDRQALERFREFLRVAPDPGDPVIKQAHQFVKELQAASEKPQRKDRARPAPGPSAKILSSSYLPAPGPAGLRDELPPRPLYKKPWFWVVATAVVAGGVTAALLATRPRDAPPLCPECNFPPTTLGAGK